MVDDIVEHQVKVPADCRNFLPCAQGRIDLKKVHDRKTIIGRIGEKGQKMNVGDNTFQVLVGKCMQHRQGRFIILFQGVTVGDQNHVFLGEIRFFFPLFYGVFFD
jgi:hypothetical protein